MTISSILLHFTFFISFLCCSVNATLTIPSYFLFQVHPYWDLFKLVELLVTGLLGCSVLLEFSFCKSMCIWVTCICWIHHLCLSFIISIASIEWAAACLHSLLGHQHIYFQCSIHIFESEDWKGINYWIDYILIFSLGHMHQW